MRTLPIDASRMTLVGTGKTAARAKYAELADGSRKRVPDAQDANADGVPIWIVDCLLDDEDADRAEVVSVKVASFDEPKVDKWAPVRFRGLVALGYVAQGANRVSYSFTADGIDQPKPHHQPQAA